jgi:hypothetical protein
VNEQTQLIPTGPKVTAQQAAVLAALEQAGEDGLHADECGAIAHELMESRWAHPRDTRCQFCGQRGLQVLKRLRTLGLTRYRARNKAWQACNLPQAAPEPDGWDALVEAGF